MSDALARVKTAVYLIESECHNLRHDKSDECKEFIRDLTAQWVGAEDEDREKFLFSILRMMGGMK